MVKLRTQRPKRYLKCEQAPRVSTERGSRGHSLKAALMGFPFAVTRQKAAPRHRLHIRGFGTGSLICVVSRGEGEATRRACNQEECPA